jgi:hypothetical protein
MASYNKTSPFYNTKQNNLYLELLTIRPVPAESDDFEYVIETQYKNRKRKKLHMYRSTT